MTNNHLDFLQELASKADVDTAFCTEQIDNLAKMIFYVVIKIGRLKNEKGTILFFTGHKQKRISTFKQICDKTFSSSLANFRCL